MEEKALLIGINGYAPIGSGGSENKLVFVISIVISSLFLVNIAGACITIDWKFMLNIGNLNVDTNKLEEICRQETCTISEDFITIKSHYDERVAIIISKTPSPILLFRGITIRLPYNLNEEGAPVVSEIDPEKYNWKDSVKRDFVFLKEASVLRIDDRKIEKISNLATNGKNILYCKDDWKLLDSNCMCDKKGEWICADCVEAPAFATALPQKLLTIETSANKMEKVAPTYFYYLLILLIILVIIALAILLKRKKSTLQKTKPKYS